MRDKRASRRCHEQRDQFIAIYDLRAMLILRGIYVSEGKINFNTIVC